MGLEVRDEGKASFFLEVGLCDIPEQMLEMIWRGTRGMDMLTPQPPHGPLERVRRGQ